MSGVPVPEQSGKPGIQIRFNLFWALVQTVIALALFIMPFPIFFGSDKSAGRDPVMPFLVTFGMAAVVFVPLGYFGIRGLSRREQIVMNEHGLAGKLIAKDNQVIPWSDIANLSYTNRAFLETLHIQRQNGQKIVVRDLSQLKPVSLLEIFGTIKAKIETGIFTPPQATRWWQTTTVGIIVLFIVIIIAIYVRDRFFGK